MPKAVKSAILLCMLLCCSTMSFAQGYTVQGRILENARGRSPMSFVKVELLRSDSVAIRETTTGNDGRFYLQHWWSGKFILRAQLDGYVTLYKDVEFSDDNYKMKLGDLLLSPEIIYDIDGEAVVTAQQQLLTIKADTFIFHTSAFRLPPGASLGALVQQIQGLEMDEEGNLTFHGKAVSGILVDGHEFFNDAATALQNVTAEAVQDVKIYERTDLNADFRREEEVERGTVLDLTIKPEYRRSWNANVDASVGTHHRYMGKLFVTNFDDRSRIALYGQMNNISEGLVSDGNGNWYNWNHGDGLFTYRSLGGTYSFDNGKGNREAGYTEGRISFETEHNDGHTNTIRHAQTYVNDALTHYNYSHSTGYNHRLEGSLNGTLQFNLDTLNRFSIGAYAEINRARSKASSVASVFTQPRWEEDPAYSLLDGSEEGALYAERDNSYARSHGEDLFGRVTYIHRFAGHKKRNLEVEGSFYYQHGHGKSSSGRNILYFPASLADQRIALYQYITTPNRSAEGELEITWEDAIGPVFSYQLGYTGRHERSHADNNILQADAVSILGASIPMSLSEMPTERAFFNTYREHFTQDVQNSSLALNTTFSNAFFLEAQADWERLHLEGRYTGTYLHESLRYNRASQVYNPSRDYLKSTGWLSLRWNPTETINLRWRLYGTTRRPSLQTLLPITDTSDPMSQQVNNPGLKQAFDLSHFLYADYTHQRTGANYTFVMYGNTQHNDQVTTQTVDPATGYSYLGAGNVNGNYYYNVNLSTMQPLDSARHWKVTLSSEYTQRQRHQFVGALGNAQGLTRVFTRNVGGSVNLSWNNKLFQISLRGAYTYENTSAGQVASLSEHGHLIDTKFSPQITFPSGLRISTSLAYWARFGYSDDLLNHGQWLWNATISQSFLKNKALSVELQAVDILHQRTAESFTVGSYNRSYSRSDSYLNYILLHISYRFSIN